MLRVKGDKIVNPQGRPVILKGVNLGGWLMMEGYLLGGRNIPECAFRERFTRLYGVRDMERFTSLFRQNFIREIDFALIKSRGFNCVRIPFHGKILHDGGLRFLDWALDCCRKNRLYCILDLHAAPGAQNKDWHADSRGEALLWRSPFHRKGLLQSWEFLARRYRTQGVIAGYDVLNEPVADRQTDVLNLYQDIVDTIRGVGDTHIIFLEGNRWGQEVDFLDDIEGENIAVSVHFYQPLDFLFNFRTHLRYPGKIDGKRWDRERLQALLGRYAEFASHVGRPVYVGEFGLHSPCIGCGHELVWLEDVLFLFNEFGFHWTYWTYKAVAGSVFPDGIWQYGKNPPWVRREGPVCGWENFYTLWKKQQKEIVVSWRTEEFVEHKGVSKVLRRG